MEYVNSLVQRGRLWLNSYKVAREVFATLNLFAGLRIGVFLDHVAHFLFEHLPEAMTSKEFEALLPYNIDKNMLAGPLK